MPPLPLNYTTTDMAKWGAGNGLGLDGLQTPTQVDLSFWTLSEAIVALQDNPPEANGIASISEDGLIVMDDSTEYQLDLPVALFPWRGEWTATTAYFRNDWFKVSGIGIIVALQDHTSGASFDAAATGGDPVAALYEVLLDLGIPGVVTVSGTTETPTIAATNKVHRCTHNDGCAVTVPTDADVPFVVGAMLHYIHDGVDPVTVVGDAGVTVDKPATRAAATAEAKAMLSLVKLAADTWLLTGYLADAP